MEQKVYRTGDEFLKDLPELALPFREKLKGKDESFAFSMNGQPVRYINIRSGLLTLTDQPEMTPVCTVSGDERILLELLSGKTSPMKALMFGGVRVSGSKSELLRLLVLLGG